MEAVRAARPAWASFGGPSARGTRKLDAVCCPAFFGCCLSMDHRWMLLLSILYQLVCSLLGLIAVLMRQDLSKDAELLVLRPDNTVLARQVTPVHYTACGVN